MHEIARRIFSPRGRALIFAVVLAAVTIFAYRPAWHGGFLWDDDAYIINNELLTAPHGWQRIWFSLDSPSQYFPLTYSTFRIEHALWGLNTTGYHWVNLLLHVGNALLLWAVLARLGVPGSWLAAAIFALHPVQVESVAWITERKNVLMAFDFLCAGALGESNRLHAPGCIVLDSLVAEKADHDAPSYANCSFCRPRRWNGVSRSLVGTLPPGNEP